MQDGLLTFKQQLDPTKNTYQQTDKRLLQKDLKLLQKNGYQYLDKIQTNKVNLMEFDKALQQLNPHQYQNKETLNKQILKVQILGKIKSEDEMEKFEQFVQQRDQNKYIEQINTLTTGNQFQQKHPFFLDGKRRNEDFKLPEQKIFIKTHRLGAIMSCLKSNGKYANKIETEINQSQQQDNTEQLQDVTQQEIETTENNLLTPIPQTIDEESTQMSTQFLSVFLNDKSINQDQIKSLYPKLDLNNFHLNKNLDLSQYQVPQQRTSTIILQKLNKVKFDPMFKVINYVEDKYNGEEINSIFQKIDLFQDSLIKGKLEDQVQDQEIEIFSSQEIDEQKWSNNQIDSLDKLKKQYIINQKKDQINQNQFEQQYQHQELLQKSNFNNIYLNTLQKKDQKYYANADKGKSINESIGKLQNLKFHQYESSVAIENVTSKALSQIEDIKQRMENLQEQYQDKDLDQQENYQQYTNTFNQLQQQYQQRENDIYDGLDQLKMAFPTNRIDKTSQPNFNGVTQLNFENIKEQFKVIPIKQKSYTQDQKNQFEKFYINFQNPLDILHHNTDVYQQAQEIEQNILHQQLQQQSMFQIGKLPKPQFFSNKYKQFTKDNEDTIYNAIGNKHDALLNPDKEKLKRYRYQNILTNIEYARQRFKYNL